MRLSTTAPMPEVAGVTHRWIAVGDLDVHVAEAGAGAPVVLLHGAPQHWFAWRKVIPELAADHRVIAPDLRGCGWTSAPDEGYDIDSQVGDVLAMLDALALDRPMLVTHDYSALIGWRIAFDHPEAIGGLVALGAGHPWIRPTLAMLPAMPTLWFQPVLAAPGLGALAARSGRQGTLRHMLEERAPTFDEAERESFLAVWREREHARGLSAIYRRLILPAMARLPRGEYDDRHLQVPTRAVLAGRDPVITEQSLGPWRGTAVDLRVSTAAGAGHYIASDRPDAVASAVRELTSPRR